MRIAIQGTSGSYSEAAARRLWPDLDVVPCREAADAVAAVRERRADAGCLPIENSLVGSVTTTYDLLEAAFSDGALELTHEIVYPVHHALLAVPGATLQDIRRVSSHPVAIGQCRRWLSRELPNVELVSAWDTAGSAELVARTGDRTAAAIAGRHAADVHGLAVLAERIEDDPTNQTRFLVFTQAGRALPGAARVAAPTPAAAAPPARRKTSLVVVIDHRPGMLARVLQTFAARNINLTALHSRPEPSAPWTYRFYMDIEGATTDSAVAGAIEEIASLAARLVVLGSYEASVTQEE